MLYSLLAIISLRNPWAEQEADRVAEQVMRMADQEALPSEDENEAKNALMCKQSAEPGANIASGSSDVSPVVHTVLNSGRGQSLDATTRAFMEPRFGYDFSQIRIHANERAAESARSLRALAYTLGQDIVFGERQYAPGTSEGKELIAHELTHTIQQGAVGTRIPNVQKGSVLPASSTLVQRQSDASPNASFVQQYRDALQLARQKGDWRNVAEILNSFKHVDIQSRLSGLGVNEIGYLHQGALDNPNLGPQSQIAILTEPGAPPASTAPPTATPSPRPRARDVVLEFVPDEISGGDEPSGVIHVKVKGKEVAQFDARGGPPERRPDEDNPGHYYDPTTPGPHTLERGEPHTTTAWGGFSQLRDGTPLRDTGRDVLYKKGERWVSTTTLPISLSREEIIAQEKELHGRGWGERIPDAWDLNDFGKIAFHIEGTQEFIHTTPETELKYQTGLEEKLESSHGCIHIKPSDRDKMIAAGFLQEGVTLKVHPYRARHPRGTPR